MSFRVGVIEDGGWFYPDPYIGCLKSVEDAEVPAICFMADDAKMKSSNYGTAREHFVNDLGLKPYEEIGQMIAGEKLDGVILFGEYGKKADHIEAAAEHGVKIFTTKPPASSREQMDRIVRAGAKADITIPEHSRHFPLFVKAHDIIGNGELGNVLTCRVLHDHGCLGEDETDPAHWYLREENGGPEVSLAWYTAGLMLWIVDSTPERAFAEYGNFKTSWYPHMDNGMATVRFANGCIGSMSIHFSTEWPFPKSELAVVCSEGALSLAIDENGASNLTVYRKDGPETFAADYEDSIWPEMVAWVSSGKGGASSSLTPADASGILDLCRAWK